MGTLGFKVADSVCSEKREREEMLKSLFLTYVRTLKIPQQRENVALAKICTNSTDLKNEFVSVCC